MKKLKDDWAWVEIGFADWRNAVNRRMDDVYGITLEDSGFEDEDLKSHWEEKVEVKTTNGLQTTPFYLTRNELSFSNERPKEFRICRLYDFSKKPKMFELAPPIEKLVRLEPLAFQALFN
jgi:hypothetical protein